MDEKNIKTTSNSKEQMSNNSLGLLALEYNSNSEDESVDNDQEKDTVKSGLFSKKSSDNNVNSSNKTLNIVHQKENCLGNNTVNLFEFAAKLNSASGNSTLDILETKTINQPVLINVEDELDENDTDISSDQDSVNLLEYVANLQKMRLPYSNVDENNLDILNSKNENNRINTAIDSTNKNTEHLMEYRTQPAVVELSSSEDSEPDSSSSESSNSSESSSSSDSDESGDDIDYDHDKDETSSKISSDENSKKSNNSDRNNKRRGNQKGEFDNLPPIEDLKISIPEVLCDPMGEVAWFVEQMVIIKPKPEKPTLNLDTVLFIKKGRRVLGKIFDVFGTVQEPHYCVRFNSEQHIKEHEIKIGMTVYYCPNSPHTTLVFLSELIKMKATDASDYSEHPEFSDDEEEQAYYANLKKKNVQKKDQGNVTNDYPQKRIRTNETQSSWHKRKTKSDTMSQKSNNSPRSMQQPQFRPPHQAMFYPQPMPMFPPQMPPNMHHYHMPPYPMPPYIPNMPYSFGNQNWPRPHLFNYNNYDSPMLPAGSMIPRRQRFPDPTVQPRPRARFPATEIRHSTVNAQMNNKSANNSMEQ